MTIGGRLCEKVEAETLDSNVFADFSLQAKFAPRSNAIPPACRVSLTKLADSGIQSPNAHLLVIGNILPVC